MAWILLWMHIVRSTWLTWRLIKTSSLSYRQKHQPHISQRHFHLHDVYWGLQTRCAYFATARRGINILSAGRMLINRLDNLFSTTITHHLFSRIYVRHYAYLGQWNPEIGFTRNPPHEILSNNVRGMTKRFILSLSPIGSSFFPPSICYHPPTMRTITVD